jgi:exonuclease VII small subunit
MSDERPRISSAASAVAAVDTAMARLVAIVNDLERQVHELDASVTALEERELMWRSAMLNEILDAEQAVH